MRHWNLSEWVIVGLVSAVFAIGVLVFGFLIPAQVRAERDCLAYGYPATKLAFPMTPYCVRRVNQTDEVVLLSTLRGVK